MSDGAMQGLLGIQLLSGGVGLFILFMGILAWLLCVILFFKIWGMTNDISQMKNMLKEWLDIEHPVVDTNKASSQDEK